MRPALLTVNDLAQFLAVSRGTVYRLVRKGDLVPCYVGEGLRFRPEDIEQYLSRHQALVDNEGE